jgi:hypothetical protein
MRNSTDRIEIVLFKLFSPNINENITLINPTTITTSTGNLINGVVDVIRPNIVSVPSNKGFLPDKSKQDGYYLGQTFDNTGNEFIFDTIPNPGMTLPIYKLQITNTSIAAFEKDKIFLQDPRLVNGFYPYYVSFIKYQIYKDISNSLVSGNNLFAKIERETPNLSDNLKKNLIRNILSNIFNNFLNEQINLFSKQYVFDSLGKPVGISSSNIPRQVTDKIQLDLEQLYKNKYDDIITIENLNDLEKVDKNIIKLDKFSFFKEEPITCIKIDNDLLDVLLEQKINLNLRDNAGNSPIYYAIEQMNLEAIEKISKKFKNGDNIKNKLGLSPADYAIKLFGNKEEKINYKFAEQILEKKRNIFLEKLPYKYLPKYSENIIPILIALINQNFYLKNTNVSDLLTALNIDANKKTLIFDTDYQDKIRKVQEIIDQENLEINNIDLSKEPNRKNEKINKQKRLDIIKLNLDKYKNTRQLSLDFNGDTIGKIYDDLLFTKLNNTMDSSFNITELQIAWNNYLKTGDKQNKYNLHNIISNSDISQNTINIISNYYKDLMPYIRDYFELSKSALKTENIPLHEALDMISITYTTIISANLFLTIKKLIEKYTLEKYNSDLTNSVLDSSILNNVSIIEYIFKDLPKTITRVVLKTYKDSFDILRKPESQRTIDYFKKINEFLMSSSLAINVNDPLIKTLESEVYIYYNQLSEIIIPLMKDFIDNYYRMILYEGKIIKINQILNK